MLKFITEVLNKRCQETSMIDHKQDRKFQIMREGFNFISAMMKCNVLGNEAIEIKSYNDLLKILQLAGGKQLSVPSVVSFSNISRVFFFSNIAEPFSNESITHDIN